MQRADGVQGEQGVARVDVIDLDIAGRCTVGSGQRVDIGFQRVTTTDTCTRLDFQCVGRDVVGGRVVVTDGGTRIEDDGSCHVGNIVQRDVVDFCNIDRPRGAVNGTE